MPDPQLFRRALAARILGVLGAAALFAPGASCGPAVIGAATTSTGGTAGATTSQGSGGAGAAGTGGTAGNGGAPGAGGTAGNGGAGGNGGAAGSGGGPSNPPTKVCFSWPLDMASPDAGPDDAGPNDAGVIDAGSDDAGPGDAGPPCPTDTTEILAVFESFNCPKGWEPSQILSGPTIEPGQCCYMTENMQCGPGGRPYLVDAGARLADPERGAGRNGWSEGEPPCLDGLTPGERASLAEAWTAAALFEHASVASFSRCSLELLAMGAPADLVERAHRAALDEIRHARLCFALASAYAGEDLAPGPFPLGGEVSLRASLAEIAVATVVEGCVGETVAAVMAAEQLARATDPAVEAALTQITDDEARHAELAWRTVAWAVRAGGSEVRAAVERAFLAELAGDRKAQGVVPRTERLEAHGFLDAGTRAEIVARAMAEVVGPSARALISQIEATPRRDEVHSSSWTSRPTRSFAGS